MRARMFEKHGDGVDLPCPPNAAPKLGAAGQVRNRAKARLQGPGHCETTEDLVWAVAVHFGTHRSRLGIYSACTVRSDGNFQCSCL